MTLNWKTITALLLGAFILLWGVWALFFRQSASLATAPTPAANFGVATTQTVNTDTPDATEAAVVPQTITQKIFQISSGPVAGATLIEASRPTTTIARFVLQTNGHVFDLPLDTPGAVARALSNTTVPGIERVLWAQQGSAALAQYPDGSTIKTLRFGFSAGASTSTLAGAVRIQFFPNNILGLAVSPDGNSVAYVLAGASGGVDGYTAKNDGSSQKKVFSLPISQVALSWPSPNTLLAYSKPAVGVAGIALSINAGSGAVSPLLYAQGLTAFANKTFSKVLYQSASSAGKTTYSHDVLSGADTPLSFNPMPERCIESTATSSLAYCAVPLGYTSADFMDLWHQGVASAADSIVSFDLVSGKTTIVATPGGADGGTTSDIAEMALSPDGEYLLYITKGDRGLWGVRLGR